MLRITFGSLFLLIGLGGTFTNVSLAAAAKKNPQPAVAKGNKANAPAAGNAQLIQQLETIRTNLNKADHDYKGHRATAVHEISHAIHLLQHGKPDPNPGQHFTAGTHKEPQATSDAQLKQSLAALKALTVHAGPHQAQVQAAINKAETSLQAALKVA